VDIKKSSYKKLAPFLKVASKASWIVTKEIKGELTVMSVNPTHPEYVPSPFLRDGTESTFQGSEREVLQDVWTARDPTEQGDDFDCCFGSFCAVRHRQGTVQTLLFRPSPLPSVGYASVRPLSPSHLDQH
jgi:hypothetical protein